MKKKRSLALKNLSLVEGNPVKFLEAWYYAHCDDEWEHGYGVKIDTIDNPGWSISIDLDATEFALRPDFKKTKGFKNKLDWMAVWKEGAKFEGCGGPQKLFEIIEFFREWTVNENAELR